MSKVRPQRAEDSASLSQWINQTGIPVREQAWEGDISLVLADGDERPIACLRLRPRLGLDLPRYSFHLGRIVHASTELRLFRVQPTLLLGNDHTGESELLDLACSPALDGHAQVLSLGLLVQAALARIAA